jgi:hypothetical protein
MSRVSKKELFFSSIISLFFLPIVVSARPANPNRFPNTPPLRPPMENIAPNYPNNIDAAEGLQGNGLDFKANENKDQGVWEKNQENPQESAAEKNGGLPKTSRILFLIVLILVFTSIAGAFIYVFREKQAAKNRDKKSGFLE